MRSLWKGSLSFGLVNIPVEVYTASSTKDVKFTMLHKKDLSEIRYARICKNEDKEVPWNEIVKGYENEKGNYVILTDEDFKKAALEKTDTIDIVQFVDPEEIDSIYYEKPYILEPQKGAAKSYSLLIEALKKSKKVGIVHYVIHNRAHIGVVKPNDNFLILNQLRYKSEIHLKEVKIPKLQKIAPKELNIAIELIDQMSEPFKPEKFKDTYHDEIKQIIKQKEKGKKVSTKPKARAASPKVHDIMSLLKESLKGKEKKTKKRKIG